MEYLIVGLVAFLASLLTFFSGFGLGTLLTPVFVVFFPIEIAVAGTGLVHFSNNIFKIILVGESVSKNVVLRFGLPGMVGAAIGATLLIKLTLFDVLYQTSVSNIELKITPVNLIIGLVLIAFATITRQCTFYIFHAVRTVGQTLQRLGNKNQTTSHFLRQRNSTSNSPIVSFPFPCTTFTFYTFFIFSRFVFIFTQRQQILTWIHNSWTKKLDNTIFVCFGNLCLTINLK